MKLVIEPGRAEANYWQNIWRYRELAFFLAWRDVTVRYKQTAIGIGWVVLRPLLTMMVFVAFRRVVGLSSSEIPDSILVFAAVLPWQFFSTALTEASSSLLSSANLITKVYFPRLIVPVAAACTSAADFIVGLVMVAGLMLWNGIIPSWTLLVLPFFVLLIFASSIGAGLFLAALNVQYRDFRYIVPFIVQFGVFVSPIAFRTQDIPEQWRLLYSLNPMVGIIDGFRWSILGGRTPFDPDSLIISVAVALCLLWLGVWYFRRIERGFADVI